MAQPPLLLLALHRLRAERGTASAGLKPANLGGKRGLIKYAVGYGLQGSSGYYWANHTWFFWREHGIGYAASLHYFGAGTTQLLGRLIRELRPTAELRP